MNVWAAHVSLTSNFWQGNEREYQLCEPYYPLMLNALTSAPSPWRRFNFTTHIGLILISVLLYPSACVNLYLWHIWRYLWAASSYKAKSLLLLPTENMFQLCKRISLHENVSIPQAYKRRPRESGGLSTLLSLKMAAFYYNTKKLITAGSLHPCLARKFEIAFMINWQL